jgi:4-diphosphocytidyl-2-C-methyl-D-erythritol kinase
MQTAYQNLPAPAKLNLFLHVVGRRADGYHLLESIFILIDLADSLDIELLESGEIRRTGDIVGDPEKDLCVRAAHLLQEHADCRLGARIHLRKRIPSGAGLGGGSSDAATTLIALNRLWNLGLCRKELIGLGAKLGADVPFFIFGESAFAQGIGEDLQAFEIPPSSWAIVMPDTPTGTAGIFADPNLTRDTKSLKIISLSELIQSNWPHLPGHNDLQPVVERRSADVRRALAFLGKEARMTGSGSAVFVHAPDKTRAAAMLKDLYRGATGYAADTVPVHPLHAWVSDHAC